MSNSDNPKNPYIPNDPRNSIKPTVQKNPFNPTDSKNPKNPFYPGGTANPKGPLNTGAQETDTSTLRPSETQKKTIQASDIKALIQNKGTVTLNGRELVLKDPAATDPRLQAMINEPTLSVTPIGKPSESGVNEYELTSAGRIVTIKIDSKKI